MRFHCKRLSLTFNEGHALNSSVKRMAFEVVKVSAEYTQRCICYDDVTQKFGIVEQIFDKFEGETLDIDRFYFPEWQKTVIYQTNNMQDNNRYLVEYLPESCKINRIESI